MNNDKQKALQWWDNLPLYQSNDLLRKYGYFGHDMGVTEDEIIGIWKDEARPEPNDLQKAAQNYADKVCKVDTNDEKYKCKQDFIAGVEWQKDSSCSFTLEQMLEAITYGFQYHRDSMHDNQDVPNGNKLQWILGNYIDPLKHKEFIEKHNLK